MLGPIEVCEEAAEIAEPKNISSGAGGTVYPFDPNSDALYEPGIIGTELLCALSNAPDAIMNINTSPPSLRRNASGKKPRQPPL
jgi:hypothetical protein